MRLIDADAAIDALDKLCDRMCPYSKKQRAEMCRACTLGSAFEVIDNMPTVDAVEVVRCKDCKHYNAGFECLKEGYGIEYPQDYFCGSAERRQDVQNKT